MRLLALSALALALLAAPAHAGRIVLLDETADRYVAGAPAVPLHNLLNHTSGLYNHSYDPRVLEGWPLKQWRPEELLKISLEHPLTDGFHYSNTNYVLLGMIVERVTGRPIAHELQRRIIRPLHLKQTAYDEGPEIPGVVHSTFGGLDVTVQNTSWAGAAGAVVSSARDLATFYGSLDRLLPRRQYAAMHTGTYGLGLFPIKTRCGTAWGHNGAVPGYYTDAFTRGTRTAIVFDTGRPTDGRAVAGALCRR